MPTNAKGGKGYKKKKKTQGNRELVQIVRQAGQMPARAIRLLGNRQVLCYCNDDVIRNCHICGRMKGRDRVNIGDIVLISLRDWSTLIPTKQVKLGDIIDLYSRDHFSYLKKEPAVNKRLFLQLELANGYTVSSVGEDCSGNTLDLPEDDGIEFEEDTEEEDDGETKIVPPAQPERDIELDEL